MVRRILIAAACTLGAVAALPAAASACTLAPPSGPQSVDITVHEAGAAVVGTVVSTTTPDPLDPNGFADTVLAVERVVKGPVTGPRITLRHSTNGGLCGFTMTVGERYGVVGEAAADASTFAQFSLFDETQLGQDTDLDGVGAATDACPETFDPENACAGPPGVAVVRHSPARLGLLRRGGWGVRVKSDAAASAIVRLTARIGGKRRLLAEFAADLAPGRGVRVPLSLGVVERGWIRGRDRLAARVRVVARGAGGQVGRATRELTFRRG